MKANPTADGKTADEKLLSVDYLMDAASRQTGLSDWGDESFRTPLGILCKSYIEDGALTSSGYRFASRFLTSYLINRLLIQDELRRRPEILREEIKNPLFIVSLPRTGTSLLQYLLSRDPANRSLLYWETLRPSPAPEPGSRDSDPRIEAAANLLKEIYRKQPVIKTIHKANPKKPHECFFLLMNTFMFPSFYFTAKVTQYSEWLKGRDMAPVYRYYRNQLRILQSRIPTNRWLLKSPFHMYFLDTLLTVFPDAGVIQTHRDPANVIPSMCSLIAAARGVQSDHVDPVDIGEEFLGELKRMIECGMRARETFDASKFFDVSYRELVEAPIETVRRIYDHFGLEFTADFEKGMREWLDANPKNKHGSHQYSLERFGMDKDMVDRAFASYQERFGI